MSIKTPEENLVTTYRIVDTQKAEVRDLSESFEEVTGGNPTELLNTRMDQEASKKDIKGIRQTKTSIKRPKKVLTDDTDFTRFVTSTLNRLKIKLTG